MFEAVAARGAQLAHSGLAEEFENEPENESGEELEDELEDEDATEEENENEGERRRREAIGLRHRLPSSTGRVVERSRLVSAFPAGSPARVEAWSARAMTSQRGWKRPVGERCRRGGVPRERTLVI
jgi:hypothetical protein